MPLMKWGLLKLWAMHAADRKLLVIPADCWRFGSQTGPQARSHQRRDQSLRDGGGVPIWQLALNTGRGHCRARIFATTAPRAERPGRGADRGYSFVSISHHTARGRARTVPGA